MQHHPQPSPQSSSLAEQILSNVLMADIQTHSTTTNPIIHRATSTANSWSTKSMQFNSFKHSSRSTPLITIYDHSVPEIPIHELCLKGLERLSSLPVRQRPSIINNSTLKDRRLLFVPPIDSRGRAIQGRCWSRKSAQQYAIIQAQARAQAQLLAQHFSSQPPELSRVPSRNSLNNTSHSNTRDLVRSALSLGNPSVGNVNYHTVHASLLEDQRQRSSYSQQPEIQQKELPSAPYEPKWELVMSNDEGDDEDDEFEVVDSEDKSDDGEAQDQDDPLSFTVYPRNSISHELPSVLRPGPYSNTPSKSISPQQFEDYEVDVQVGFGGKEVESSSSSDSEIEMGMETDSDDDSEDSFDSDTSTPSSSSSCSDESDDEEMEVLEESKSILKVTAINPVQTIDDSPSDLIFSVKDANSLPSAQKEETEDFEYEWKSMSSYSDVKDSKSKITTSATTSPKLRSSPYSMSKRQHQRSKAQSHITIPIPAYLNPSFETSTRSLSRR